jgi:hypothetical protein
MSKRRISIIKENRIVSLLTQGYDRDSVARICNCGVYSIGHVLRRVRRRPVGTNGVRLGRGHSFLSDDQIEDIRTRRAQGEILFTIAEDYEVDSTTICSIAKGRTYRNSEEGYPFDFSGLDHVDRRRRL